MTVQTVNLPVAQILQEQLTDCIGDAKFQRWFAAAQFKIQDTKLKVTVPTQFFSTFITRNFFPDLKKIASQHLGENATVDIEIDPSAFTTATPSTPTVITTGDNTSSATKTEAPAPAPLSLTRATLPISVKKHLRYNLKDFVVGPSNELAYAAASRLAEQIDCDAMSPLFVHSSCGMGKTHLLQGLCKRYAALNPNAKWAYTTAEQFTNQYITAIRANKLGEFRRKLRNLDLLAVDDVHFFSNKTATQTEFLHTFNAMNLQGAKLVLASDAHPKQIKQLVESLSSRFMSGMVVHIDPPETETREQMIRHIAKQRSIKIMDSVIDQLALHADGSVREIEGLVTRLQALASLTPPKNTTATPDPIGHALANRVIGANAPLAERKPIQLETIMTVVCQTLSVEKAQVLSPSRHRRIVLARSVIIYLARHFTTLSFPELAKKLSRNNHSTIVTAAKRVEQQIQDKHPLPIIDLPKTPTLDKLVTHLKHQVVKHRD